jgi:hypothetical protein
MAGFGNFWNHQGLVLDSVAGRDEMQKVAAFHEESRIS